MDTNKTALNKAILARPRDYELIRSLLNELRARKQHDSGI